MSNITVSVSSFNAPNFQKFYNFAPLCVYTQNNHPKISFQSIVYSSSLSKVGFARQSYNPYGDSILFQIFPLYYCGGKRSFDYFYSNTSFSQPDSYPSMVINPNGNLISAPVYFDSNVNFSQNKIDFTTNDNSSDYYNWTLPNDNDGYYFGVGNSDNFMTDEKYFTISSDSNKFKKTNSYYGISTTVNFQGQSTPFTYINGRDLQLNGMNYNKGTNKNTFAKRNYKQNGYNYLPSAISSCTAKSDHYPFFLAININGNKNGNAQIDFGNNRIQISNNGCSITIASDEDKWFDEKSGKPYEYFEVTRYLNSTKCNLYRTQRTLVPQFIKKSDAFANLTTYTMIVYPCYCGIAVQPGIQLPFSDPTLKKQSTQLPNGSVCSIPIPTKKRYPTLDVWYDNAQSTSSYVNQNSFGLIGDFDTNSLNIGNPDISNIWLQPTSADWGDSLRLRLNNCTANFFFMPILFLSKSRFRMYFKGIKSGKYTKNAVGKANKKAAGVAINQYCSSNDQWKTDCKDTVSIQYKYRASQVDDQEGKYQVYASHKYFASLIYTFEEGKKDQIANITVPSLAYRIPPYKDGDEVNVNGKTYKIQSQYWEKYNSDGYYFDFEIETVGGTYIKRPVQVVGVLILQVTRFESSLLQTDNGQFTIKASTLYDCNGVFDQKGQLNITKSDGILNKAWTNYIQSISVSLNQQGASGSITVDKYAFLGQQFLPQQSIGGIQLEVQGGNENIIVTSGSNLSECNQIFTGFGTKMSCSDSFSSDTITVQLQGLQRKMQDIKLINPPFWDGGTLKQALKWIGNYCGVKINYNTTFFRKQDSFETAAYSAIHFVDQNGNPKERTKDDFPRLPSSSNFNKPAVNFPSGTDCFTAITKLCQMANCRMVIQSNGEIYILTQKQYAVPPFCCDSDFENRGYDANGFDEKLIISFSVQPYLNNLHNFIFTGAFKATNVGTAEIGAEGNAESGFTTAKLFQQIKTTPNIPWSKIKAFKHDGFMNDAKLQQQFARDITMVRSYWMNIKVTIPGNQTINLYDKIELFGKLKCYVSQINHNVDLVNKTWTTQLVLNTVIKDKKQT